MQEQQKANHLINETSPYLLQHAWNPVAWYPWNDEALQLARRENKPILLSIGYSACHWCHVMAHESFEDPETAELMNKYFINIKIDREERPDIDRIYQTAQYLLTQRSGGWPLTMFLTPDDHIPFFGGTYFPPESRHGLPGFRDLLERIAVFYQQEHQSIRQQNTAVIEALQRTQEQEGDTENVSFEEEPLEKSVQELSLAYDQDHGGFGNAPKFPTPVNLVRLLRRHELGHGDQDALEMSLHSLRKMAAGGIYDQIGGGFCRYSVDQKWMIPHFEKMLYDNGQLLSLYADAWHVSRDEIFRKVSLETVEWLIREMLSPEGGFYSSLDADSEGFEGKFYTWSPDSAREVLDNNEYGLAAMHYGLDQPPNFEGQWHLFISQPIEEVAAVNGMQPAAARKLLESARLKLYAARNKRIRPGRDEKILTSWNALAIKGLADAALRFDQEINLQHGEAALRFIHEKLWHEERLLATYKDGRSHLNAYLDDYAYLIDAILALLQVNWSSHWLGLAVQLADCLLEKFYDQDKHGFFFTSNDHEALIQRRKDFMDDATPSGNGVAAWTLAKLGHLVGDHRYTEAAQNTVRAAWYSIERAPSACSSMLTALEDQLYPPKQIVIRGERQHIEAWHKQILGMIGLRDCVYAIPHEVQGLPEILQRMTSKDNASAFICEGFTCHGPVTNLEDLADHLKTPC